MAVQSGARGTGLLRCARNDEADQNAAIVRQPREIGETVGGFCCPAPPKPLESASVDRWVQPRSGFVTSGR
ncbi:hypothetical protein NMD1_01836 [Novosphingobium sp. MD-1]|nr:hypothetical protein NMD1_01836 [Novosphingobium sp. MD-1]